MNKQTAFEILVIVAIILVILVNIWMTASFMNVVINNGSSESVMNIWRWNFFRLFK